MTKPATTILTIGHSTRTLQDFIHWLQEYGVSKIVDIRTVPRSRHNPQFNRESLPNDLISAGIGYVHMPGLGGLRHPRADSTNTGWRNASFRGFADYMETQEFKENLQKLIDLANQGRIALMCAESVPWRCHRSLVGDALQVRGIQVEHMLSPSRSQPHTITPWARIEGTRIFYPMGKKTKPQEPKPAP